MRKLLTVLMAATLVAAACNGDGDDAAISEDLALALAEAGILRTDDLPEGWEEQSSGAQLGQQPDDEEDDEFDQAAAEVAACDDLRRLEEADAVASGESELSLTGGAAEVTSEATVVATESQAAELFGQVEDADAARCFQEVIDTVLAGEELPPGVAPDISTRDIDPPDVGDEALGLEVTFSLMFEGLGGFEGGIEFIGVRQGPALLAFVFSEFGEEGIAPADRDAAITAAVERVAAALS